MATQRIAFLAILLSGFILTDAAPRQFSTEKILLNVTTVSEANQRTHNLQINLNISVVDNQTIINDTPLLSGVTRLTCQGLLLDTSNDSDVYATAVMRVMVDQSHLKSDAGEEVVLLVLNEEVIELDDEKVQQPYISEVKILLNQNSEELQQITNVYPMSKSKLSLIPRENDIVLTDPSISKKVEDQVVLHTTSHYPLKHAETTQEEIAAPGKLPETPLRMDPDLLYDPKDEEDDYMEPLPPQRESLSSYKAMCRWVDELRDRLRRFWTESLPLFFLIMWVVVVGVVGSAVIVKILDVLFPSCEHKGFFHLNPETLMPEDEKRSLVENIEIDTRGEEAVQ